MFTEEIGHPKTPFGAIMTEVDSFASHVFHECPYNGEFRVLNFTIPNSYLQFYPKGDYKVVFKLYDDFDNNRLEIKLFATVTIRNGTYL